MQLIFATATCGPSLIFSKPYNSLLSVWHKLNNIYNSPADLPSAIFAGHKILCKGIGF